MNASQCSSDEAKDRFHPAADIFPLMQGEQYEEFKASIQRDGIQVPVVYLGDQIIDGRNRYLVSRELGVECPEKRLALEDCPDPIAFVLQQNLHRRHLSQSQRAMAAARAREMYDELAKERRGDRTDLVENLPPGSRSRYGKARDQAGKATGVSGRSVDYASKVQKCGSDEPIRAVEDEEMAVSVAAEIADFPKEQQGAAIKAAKAG